MTVKLGITILLVVFIVGSILWLNRRKRKNKSLTDGKEQAMEDKGTKETTVTFAQLREMAEQLKDGQILSVDLDEEEDDV